MSCTTTAWALDFSEEYTGLNIRELTLLEMDRPFHPSLKAELARVSACNNQLGLAIHYINWIRTFAQSKDQNAIELERFQTLLQEEPSAFQLKYCQRTIAPQKTAQNLR